MAADRSPLEDPGEIGERICVKRHASQFAARLFCMPQQLKSDKIILIVNSGALSLSLIVYNSQNIGRLLVRCALFV